MHKNKNRLLLAIIAATIIVSVALFGYVEIRSYSVVPVLMYHAFQEKDTKSTPNVTPEIFRKQVKFFVDNGYNIVGPDKVIAYMTKKEKMPAKTVAITIDDGDYSFYEKGYPVLKEYNVPAVLFMPTDRIGLPGYVGWKELREMSDSGLITIGSHTMSHPWLPAISVDEKKVYEELALSKDVLEKGTGKKVEYLCYPNGGFNDLIRESAKKYGYKGAFTTNPDKDSPIDDIYAIRRLKMSSSTRNPVIIWGKVSRYYAWIKERR